jgi:AcrR family transcriptional regulator
MTKKKRAASAARRGREPRADAAATQPYLYPTLPLTALRRRPMQQRGFERVVAILDACETLLQSHHFEEIGTAEIAGEAGLKIGTLYFFFEDRAAIFTCLIERVLVEIRSQFEAEPIDGGIDPNRYVSLLLSRLTAVWGRHAALMTLYHSFQHKPEIKARRDQLQRFAVERLCLLLRRAGQPSAVRRASGAAWVLYDLMISCLDARVHLAEGDLPEISREWRHAISGYIASLSANE